MPNLINANAYHFQTLTEIQALKEAILSFCESKQIFGTIILAEEGINICVCAEENTVSKLFHFLSKLLKIESLNYRSVSAEFIPFKKLKILCKKEIITFGLENFNKKRRGISVSPEDWNALAQDSEVLLLDTRNHYEVALGTFKNALNPNTASFTEFRDFVNNTLDSQQHKKIAMFCTGGIRCEKASAYLLEQGFETVYQLQGGILNYLDKTDPKNSCWEGQCFVFDERITENGQP